MHIQSKKAAKQHTKNDHKNPSFDIRSIPYIPYLHLTLTHLPPPLSCTLGTVILETPGIAYKTSRRISQKRLGTAEQSCNDRIHTALDQGVFTGLFGCKTRHTTNNNKTENQTNHHKFLCTVFNEFFHLDTSFLSTLKQNPYQHAAPQNFQLIDIEENA
jgi:hypothetical protein